MKSVPKLDILLGKKVPDPIGFRSNEIWTGVIAEAKKIQKVLQFIPYNTNLMIYNFWQENTVQLLCVKKSLLTKTALRWEKKVCNVRK
jgi:hypothetical protein